MKSIIIIAFLTYVFLPSGVCGQASERSAQKLLQKQKWSKAFTQLKKSLRKDNTNAIAHLLMANYFFAPENPEFQIDSAYQYTTLALANFTAATTKARDRMSRFPLDSATLTDLREQIDSAAFQRAKAINTEQSYIDFLAKHEYALQRNEAEELRDDAAFSEALKRNTYPAFLDFINRYPQSKKVSQARESYERLLYEARTRDQRLSSFETFLKENPQTPFRYDAEKNIFELSTASGTRESFETFLKKYPENREAKRARNILYHILVEEHLEATLPEVMATDSLHAIARSTKSYLIPFLKHGKFGFMDETGKEILEPAEEEIGDDYLCGNITEDVIALNDKIIARSGSIVWKGKVDDLDDLGYGYLKIGHGGCTQVVHKTGFPVGEGCYDKAKVVQGKLIALQRKNEWYFFTLAGRRLQSIACDDVSTLADALLLRRGARFGLSSVHDMVNPLIGERHTPQFLYDEVKLFPNQYVWVRSGNTNTLLDPMLRVAIPPAEQALAPAFFGYVATTPKATVLLNRKAEEIATFQKAEIQEPWVAVKLHQGSPFLSAEPEKACRLFNPYQNKFIGAPHDSIHLYGLFAIGIDKDLATIYLPAANPIEVKQPVKFDFLSGQDNMAYLVTQQHDKKTVYNTQGEKLFTISCDRIQYAGDGFFIIHRKEKKGLVNADGKTILPVEYDAIGSAANGTLSLLRSMKFGLLNYRISKLIKPEYDKNILPYGQHELVAFKSGGYGFIDWNNKPQSKFEFTEVQHWNDTIALVKHNGIWAFYNLKTRKVFIDNLKNVKFIRQQANDKLAIVQQNENFGVIHNTKGIIIPIRFSDLVNVGSPEHPTYFTEKHVEEASLFVVIYYDHEGQFLRREVYEQSDYERIYCSD